MTLRIDANFEENWFVLNTQNSQISTLIGSFCAKYITFDLKKFRGIMFYDTEEWRKIWRKIDL